MNRLTAAVMAIALALPTIASAHMMRLPDDFHIGNVPNVECYPNMYGMLECTPTGEGGYPFGAPQMPMMPMPMPGFRNF